MMKGFEKMKQRNKSGKYFPITVCLEIQKISSLYAPPWGIKQDLLDHATRHCPLVQLLLRNNATWIQQCQQQQKETCLHQKYKF